MPHDRGVPARVPRHARPHQEAAAGPVRRPHGDRRAVPSGTDADGHRVHQPQAPQRRCDRRLSAPEARRYFAADLRRDPLSRAGDADRASARRLLARRRGSAPARDGQEEARGDGAATRRVRQRCDGARRRARARGLHLRPHGDVRRLRIQQVARRGLRADRVSDRLAQGALHRGVHGRGSHRGSRQHGPARRAQGRLHAVRDHARAAGHQPLGVRVHRWRAEAHLLRPRCAQGRRPKRGRRDRKRA